MLRSTGMRAQVTGTTQRPRSQSTGSWGCRRGPQDKVGTQLGETAPVSWNFPEGAGQGPSSLTFQTTYLLLPEPPLLKATAPEKGLSRGRRGYTLRKGWGPQMSMADSIVGAG